MSLFTKRGFRDGGVSTKLKDPLSLDTSTSSDIFGRRGFQGKGTNLDELVNLEAQAAITGGKSSNAKELIKKILPLFLLPIILLLVWFFALRNKYTLLEFIMLPFDMIAKFFKWLADWITSSIGLGSAFEGPSAELTLPTPPLQPTGSTPVGVSTIDLGGVQSSGIGVLSGASSGQIGVPAIQETKTEIVKHVMSDCPPCNCDCECPKCEECDHKPYEMEIKYLKDMVRFIGAIAMRENAINAQFRELHPGFTVNSPHVRQLSYEYNYIKNELRKDKDQWQYFKNYFSKLSGIPSTSSAIHYDLLLE